RSKEEVDNQPDRVPDGVEYIYDPVFSEDLTNSSKSITDLDTQAHDDADFGCNHMHYAYADMIESEPEQRHIASSSMSCLKIRWMAKVLFSTVLQARIEPASVHYLHYLLLAYH